MEKRIGSLDMDEHGCRVSCKVLYMPEDAFHEVERIRCVLWYHGEDSRKGPIYRTLLEIVYYDRSDGVCDLMGTHDKITDFDRRGCCVSGSGNTVDMM